MESKTRFVVGVRAYQGSCHCGAVRFEVDLDLSAGTTRCNCRYCTKSGWWGVIARPEAFRLLAGEDALSSPAPGFSERRRCATCGLLPFGRGDLPELGGAFVSINVRCLDGVDLAGVPIRYLDGLHDTWAELAVRPWADPFASAAAVG